VRATVNIQHSTLRRVNAESGWMHDETRLNIQHPKGRMRLRRVGKAGVILDWWLDEGWGSPVRWGDDTRTASCRIEGHVAACAQTGGGLQTCRSGGTACLRFRTWAAEGGQVADYGGGGAGLGSRGREAGGATGGVGDPGDFTGAIWESR